MDFDTSNSCEFMDESVYERRRYHSSSIRPTEARDKDDLPYNFIRFLATVKRFHVPILQITWDSHRKELGRGATSQINEAQTSLENSFAFKRIPDIEKQKKGEETIYQQLMTEISILRHPAFTRHRGVVELQGVCWDIDQMQDLHKVDERRTAISGGFSVWPVLVFETSKFGDLYQFSTSSTGRGIDVNQRLNICLTIGRTIEEMQSYRIAHGDIKPQNVLIFGDDQGFYPKVADFGFSVSHLHPDTRLSLPCSKPWVAPEHSKSPEFDFSEVLQADVYSFGVLCFWMLFERQLSGVIQLPSLSYWQDNYSREKKHPSLDRISQLKDQNDLIRVSKILIQGDADLDSATKGMMAIFFEQCLDLDPRRRPLGICNAMNLLTSERPDTPPRLEARNTNDPIGLDFMLSSSINVFYESDYRVREHVYTELKKSYSRHPEKILWIYLLICRRLRFGCREDDDVPQPATAFGDEIQVEVKQQFDRIRNPSEWVNGNTARAYRKAASEGLHALQSSVVNYRRDGVLKTAELVIRDELERAEDVLGIESRIALILRTTLVGLLMGQDRWLEAHELQLQVLEGLKKDFGPKHIETFGAMSTLCSIYQSLRRWEDAITMGSALIEELRSKYKETHADLLASTLKLATSNAGLKHWDEAERLQTRVVAIYRETLGVEDGATMNAMQALARTYRAQGKWEQAESLALEVIEASRSAYGADHYSTVMGLEELAEAYREQDRWDKAERLFFENSESCKREFGNEHPSTLALSTHLAQSYCDINRTRDGIKLLEMVVEASKKVSSTDDRRVLERRNLERRKKLASLYLDQGDFQVAESSLVKLLEDCKHKIGSQDLLTLEVEVVLAKVYFRQSCYEKALQIQSAILQATREQFGSTHAFTLTAMLSLSSIYLAQNWFEKAESLQEEVLGLLTQTLGKHHPETLACMHRVAETYTQHGRLDAADKMIYSFSQLRAQILFPDNSDTTTLDESLSSVDGKDVDIRDRETIDEGPYIVTVDMLLTAADDPSSLVLASLLRTSSQNVKLHPELTEVVAGNEDVGNEMMICLLERYGDDVKITTDVLETIFRNKQSGIALIETLLERCHNSMRVTTELLELAAESLIPGMMASLLKRREKGLKFTSKMIQKAASNEDMGDEAVSTLLGVLPRGFHISTYTLVVAAENWSLGPKILEILLSYHNCKVTVGERVLKAAAGNLLNGDEIMAVLLEKRGPEFKITEKVVKATCQNAESGKNILKLLLDARGNEIEITESILLSLVRNPFSVDSMRLVLERRGTSIEITEKILFAIARNRYVGDEMMALLVEMCEERIVVTPKLLALIGANQECGESMRSLLRKKIEITN